MIVKPNPPFGLTDLTDEQAERIANAITSEPTSGEYKVKKIRMDTDGKSIMVTHSSVAEL